MKSEYDDKEAYTTMLSKACKKWKPLIDDLEATNSGMRSMFEAGNAMKSNRKA